MKLIFLKKTLPDGRICKYHRVTQLIFSNETPNTMKVLVGSWATIETASSQAIPEFVTAIEMSYSGDSMNATDNLLERIVETSGWENSQIIDTTTINAPPPIPIEQLPEML
jgi:hypothetical protein